MNTQIKKATPALLLMTCFVLYLWCHYPGYMSYDSATHYSQVESGEWTTFQPVVFLLIWSITDVVIEGPGGMFLLLILVYTIGLGMMAYGLFDRCWQRSMLILVIMLAPFNIMLLPHIWKDIALMSFLMLSLGLFVHASPQRHWLKACALISLGLAISFRFEAALYLWPLVVLFLKPVQSHSEHWRKTGIKTGLFLVVVVLTNMALTKVNNAKKVTLWPTMALWDLAAVSIDSNENLLPDFTTGPGMTVDDLGQAFKPWSNVPLFTQTKAGINTGIDLPYTPEQYQTLFKAWLSLPFTHSQSYAAHRLRVLNELLRIKESDHKYKELYYVHRMVNHADRFLKNQSHLNRKIAHWLKNNTNAFYFKPWFYLLLGLMAMPLLYRSRHSVKTTPQTDLTHVLLTCAFLNVIVMLFLAPAGETRYVIVAMSFCLLVVFTQPKHKH